MFLSFRDDIKITNISIWASSDILYWTYTNQKLYFFDRYLCTPLESNLIVICYVIQVEASLVVMHCSVHSTLKKEAAWSSGILVSYRNAHYVHFIYSKGINVKLSLCFN
jgi:hypothetical protein